MPVDAETRFREWRVLLDYLIEHREELEAKGRIRVLVLCLQRHWQDMLRLKEKGKDGARKSPGDSGGTGKPA